MHPWLKRQRYYIRSADIFSAKATRGTRVRLIKDSAANAYRYDGFTYNKKGLKPLAFYSNDDHIFVGMEYGSTKYQWRKYPFASRQKINAKYSITEKALSFTYQGRFVETIGKWDLGVYANFDQVRWYNYFGLGNESVNLKTNRVLNRLRTKELIGKIGISRSLGKYNKLDKRREDL